MFKKKKEEQEDVGEDKREGIIEEEEERNKEDGGNGERNTRKEWSGIREGNTHSNYSSEIPFSPEGRVKILRLVKSQ